MIERQKVKEEEEAALARAKQEADRTTKPLKESSAESSAPPNKTESAAISTSGSLVQRFEQFLTRKQIEDQIKLWEDSCHSLLHPKTDSDKVGSSTH
jgi:hypothetical protein